MSPCYGGFGDGFIMLNYDGMTMLLNTRPILVISALGKIFYNIFDGHGFYRFPISPLPSLSEPFPFNDIMRKFPSFISLHNFHDMIPFTTMPRCRYILLCIFSIFSLLPQPFFPPFFHHRHIPKRFHASHLRLTLPPQRLPSLPPLIRNR